MTSKELLALGLAAALLLLSAACGDAVIGDDDTAADDDDTAAGDDDSAAGDDDTAGDDDSAAGDDDSADNDADGDGFSPGDGDCDDSDASIHAGADELCDDIDHNCDGDASEGAIDAPTWYLDADGDGYGDPGTSQASCSQPHGYAAIADDCNDSDAAYHPGAAEADCADPADYNCDGSVGYEDADSDGTAACEDCDDSNANLSTPSPESCDGVDNDCDGQVDEAGASGETPWYLDADGDGYGRAATSTSACNQPPGYVADANDCDDLDAAAYPGATEICDEIDNDCNGQVDEGTAAPSTWYADFDADGFGNPALSAVACSPPPNYIADSSDCNDLDAAANPNASEVCDGIDNNCDTQVDEGTAAPSTWYADLDGDSFGNPAMSAVACDPPPGYIADFSDCDDLDAGSYPGGTEVCDGVDNNCTGGIDEGVGNTFYSDSDGDGYGDPSSSLLACSLPAGASANALDCNDALAQVHPAAAEVCDGLDNNCTGGIDEGFDGDSDGVNSCGPDGVAGNSDDDCNDSEAASYPGNAEICDGIDNDCNTSTDEGFDSDGDGFTTCGADGLAGNSDDDCDDSSSGALFYPGAGEACDDPDYNCDGTVPPACTGTSCADILANDPGAADGVYALDPESDGNSFQAYCEMTFNGGGWLAVFNMMQRAENNAEAANFHASIINNQNMDQAVLPDSTSAAIYTSNIPLNQYTEVVYGWAPSSSADVDHYGIYTSSGGTLAGECYVDSYCGANVSIGSFEIQPSGNVRALDTGNDPNYPHVGMGFSGQIITWGFDNNASSYSHWANWFDNNPCCEAGNDASIQTAQPWRYVIYIR